MEKTKEYYMTLDYPVQIERVAGGFCAFISVLKGCKAFGETPDKAYQEIEAVKEVFLRFFCRWASRFRSQWCTWMCLIRSFSDWRI